MNEQEFKDRILSIKASLDELFNSPLVQVHKQTDEGTKFYSNNFHETLLKIAADVNQIEIGITQFSRPESWDVLSSPNISNLSTHQILSTETEVKLEDFNKKA